MNPDRQKQTVIRTLAPVRIADNGGWTDTWFARHGRVFQIAVTPGVEVEIGIIGQGLSEPIVTLDVTEYGDRYTILPGTRQWQKHPMLEAAVTHVGVPADCELVIKVSSGVPIGASLGTSAAVLVALVTALHSLSGLSIVPRDIAYTAHHIEMGILGHQCGIQDQIASAFGGINFIEISEFPSATVTRLELPGGFRHELEQRLMVVYLGKSHDSAEIHLRVIRELESAGPDCPQLEALRVTADRARDAVLAEDFTAFGRAMIDNTEAQGRLHPDIISRDAARVIDIAGRGGALGWKVNGAGGEGGTVTLLTDGRPETRGQLAREIESDNTLFRILPVRLSETGVQVWRS
jgi:D-glycero-alpha-D-manno-heptose-7-phosphate kinase